MRALIDKLKENPEPLQSLGKMLNDKKERERSLLESNSKIPAARTLLSENVSTCDDPCSDTPASVDCMKQCTTPVLGDKSACLDVSLSEVLAKLEPISGLPAPSQQVRLNYTLRVRNNCPQTIKDVTYQVEGTGGCPLPSTFIPAPVSGSSIQLFSADASPVAPGDSAGVKAGQDTSLIARCDNYTGYYQVGSSSQPSSLSIDISASGTDSTTNSRVSSQDKSFQYWAFDSRLGPTIL